MSAGITAVNYAAKAGNSLGGKTMILALAKVGGGAVTQAILDNVIRSLGQGVDQGSSKADAFTVAAVAGTAGSSTTIYLAVQGTGTIATDTSDWNGVTDASVTLTATFDQNPA
jgi:hypothetical protein